MKTQADDTYQLWQLGNDRDKDALLHHFPSLPMAVRGLDEARQIAPKGHFELRKSGVRVDIDDGVPSHVRSTRPRLRAVDQDEPAA